MTVSVERVSTVARTAGSATNVWAIPNGHNMVLVDNFSHPSCKRDSVLFDETVRVRIGLKYDEELASNIRLRGLRPLHHGGQGDKVQLRDRSTQDLFRGASTCLKEFHAFRELSLKAMRHLC